MGSEIPTPPDYVPPPMPKPRKRWSRKKITLMIVVIALVGIVGVAIFIQSVLLPLMRTIGETVRKPRFESQSLRTWYRKLPDRIEISMFTFYLSNTGLGDANGVLAEFEMTTENLITSYRVGWLGAGLRTTINIEVDWQIPWVHEKYLFSIYIRVTCDEGVSEIFHFEELIM